MPLREEFIEKYPEFREVNEAVKWFASHCRWNKYKGKCFRVVTGLHELTLWEKYGGYKPVESAWGRFVATYNEFLPWCMLQGIKPAGLTSEPIAMFEISHYTEPVSYSLSALGAPIFKLEMGYGYYMKDHYVDVEDLILAECYSYDELIPIDWIERIYINPRHPERGEVVLFAKKYGKPVIEGFPVPDIEEEKHLRTLINYLKKRGEKIPIHHPPFDLAATALAETYDEFLQDKAPLGAADALLISVRRAERTRKPIWTGQFAYQTKPEAFSPKDCPDSEAEAPEPLTKTEKTALEYLRRAYEKYPEPLFTVHSAYGLARHYGRTIEFWRNVLKSLEKKGLVKPVNRYERIWKLSGFYG